MKLQGETKTAEGIIWFISRFPTTVFAVRCPVHETWPECVSLAVLHVCRHSISASNGTQHWPSTTLFVSEPSTHTPIYSSTHSASRDWKSALNLNNKYFLVCMKNFVGRKYCESLVFDRKLLSNYCRVGESHGNNQLGDVWLTFSRLVSVICAVNPTRLTFHRHTSWFASGTSSGCRLVWLQACTCCKETAKYVRTSIRLKWKLNQTKSVVEPFEYSFCDILFVLTYCTPFPAQKIRRQTLESGASLDRRQAFLRF